MRGGWERDVSRSTHRAHGLAPTVTCAWPVGMVLSRYDIIATNNSLLKNGLFPPVHFDICPCSIVRQGYCRHLAELKAIKLVPLDESLSKIQI